MCLSSFPLNCLKSKHLSLTKLWLKRITVSKISLIPLGNYISFSCQELVWSKNGGTCLYKSEVLHIRKKYQSRKYKMGNSWLAKEDGEVCSFGKQTRI